MKKVIIKLVVFALVIFIATWFCMMAWNSWALEFNLPQFGYWHWFLTILAVRNLFGSRSISAEKEE